MHPLQTETLLIIDDDRDFVSMLSLFLRRKGYKIKTAHSAKEIPTNLSEISLILLDVNLPAEDGFTICKRLRQEWGMPILFLSARNHEEDKIRGLMGGGDDYICKPFSLEELYARIHANLTRQLHRRPSSFPFPLELQAGCQNVCGYEIELTRSESEILALLMTHPRHIFSKELIYDHLWGIDREGNPQVISEHVRNIRNKLKEAGAPELIKTHWGLGYSWIG